MSGTDPTRRHCRLTNDQYDNVVIGRSSKSPSQWPTQLPDPTKVPRVITIGRLSGRRFSIVFRLIALIIVPYLMEVSYD
jgi:hypothetical protein